MKEETEEHIKIKIAISLRKLLKHSDGKSIVGSYNKIALNADIRKGTVSDTFNAKSMPSFSTLLLIVNAMGFTLSDFAKEYDLIKDFEQLKD